MCIYYKVIVYPFRKKQQLQVGGSGAGSWGITWQTCVIFWYFPFCKCLFSDGAGDVGPRTFSMSGKRSTTELHPQPHGSLRVYSTENPLWLRGSHGLRSVRGFFGFCSSPHSHPFTLFYFRVLWIEHLESKLWSLCPCLGLLIKCIGSLSLFFFDS